MKYSRFKIILLGTTLLVGFILILAMQFLEDNSFKGLVGNLLYWLEAILILEFYWILRLGEGAILYTGFLGLVVGATLNILGVYSPAETLFRASFVLLILGTILSFGRKKNE